MQRIGIAASKIAKGNLLLYNITVILISFLFSLLLFFISGSSIVFALIIIGYITTGIIPSNMNSEWMQIIRICMISLTVIIAIVNIIAVLRNIKIRFDERN